MKSVLLCCLILCCGTIAFAQNGFENRKIELLPESHLTITGDTNISKFTCDFNTKRLERQQTIKYSEANGRIKFKDAVLTLNNQGFDCGNKAINKDFHDLIQTEKYPEISLELKELMVDNKHAAIAKVTITIAGKSKNYSLPVEIVTSPQQCVIGKLELNINDFDLKPPKKMFGLIVVKEDIEITFNLTLHK